MVEIHPFTPTYKKENGLWLLNVDTTDVPSNFTVVERNIVYIPGGEFGGNHKHPRNEAFIGIGDSLQLIWQDDEGNNHTETMSNDSELSLFVVHSLTPHVVVNKGNAPAMLIEFADDKQHDVVAVDLLNN